MVIFTAELKLTWAVIYKVLVILISWDHISQKSSTSFVASSAAHVL